MDASTSLNLSAVRQDVLADRRRPGRISAEPALVPLLRHPASGGPLEQAFLDQTLLDQPLLDHGDQIDDTTEPDEARRLVRGIGFGLLLSAPCWLIIALCGAALFR